MTDSKSTQVTASELKNINEKLDASLQVIRENRMEQMAIMNEHKAEQKELNQNLVSSIAQMSKTLSKFDSVQTEINHLDARVTTNKEEIKSVSEKHHTLSDKTTGFVAVVEDVKVVKKIAYTVVVGALFAGAYITNSAKNGNPELLLKLTEAMSNQATILQEIADKE